MIVCTTYPITF